MRILYGVTGHGFGHAMRSRVIIQELERRGHRVHVVASGRASDLLAAPRRQVTAIEGLSMRYARGGLARTRTLWHLARTGPPALRNNLARYVSDVAPFATELCISDFDSFSHCVGHLEGVPVISIDHQHVLDRCLHPREIRAAVEPHLGIASAVVRAKMPGCAEYIVSSFFRPPVDTSRSGRTTLVGPILRPEVTRLDPTDDGPVVVYRTSQRHRALLRALECNPQERFVVYGGAERARRGHVDFRRFHPEHFLRDLASAKAVITHGGYTAISEALYLRKPVLSIPLRGQGEQELNAIYLERMGLGRRVRRVTPPAVREFLEWSGRRRLQPTLTPGNDAVMTALEPWLAPAEAA